MLTCDGYCCTVSEPHHRHLGRIPTIPTTFLAKYEQDSERDKMAHHHRSDMIEAGCLFFVVVSILVTVLRMISRIEPPRGLWWDDWLDSRSIGKRLLLLESVITDTRFNTLGLQERARKRHSGSCWNSRNVTYGETQLCS